MTPTPSMTPQSILARTLWGEARDQGYDGLVAVANVVQNRVAEPSWWGSTISEVCLKPWQFSCWNKNDPNRVKLFSVTPQDPIFAMCLRIAGRVITGDLADTTNGATSYYAESMRSPPAWTNGLEPVAVIGTQKFYRIDP